MIRTSISRTYVLQPALMFFVMPLDSSDPFAIKHRARSFLTRLLVESSITVSKSGHFHQRSLRQGHRTQLDRAGRDFNRYSSHIALLPTVGLHAVSVRLSSVVIGRSLSFFLTLYWKNNYLVGTLCQAHTRTRVTRTAKCAQATHGVA
jgi:hypothetical protein